MAGAKNRVIAGDYTGRYVGQTFGTAYMETDSLTKTLHLDKNSVRTYELITDQHRKSAASGIARGIVGGALLGPVGMLAGGISARDKGIYQVAIEFRDGKRSLIECSEKVYSAIIKSCF